MLDNTENLSSELLQCRALLLRDLKNINKHSTKLHYNRTLKFKSLFDALKTAFNKHEELVWRGMNTRVLLNPLMIHEHKRGEKCEPHFRCSVFTHNLLSSFITLDVRTDVFAELLTYDEVKNLVNEEIVHNAYFEEHSRAVEQLIASTTL
tara:strand:- start:104 stop:553 length:450 start_codon:yes stop_codon:yes gene_type:complete